MAQELDPTELTASELLDRYRSTQAERQRKRVDLERAKAELLSHFSPDSVARFRVAREALYNYRGDVPYRFEISRRLHSPIKSARLARGLSQGKAAKLAGWTRPDIKDIEAGRHWTSWEMCIRMWKALELEIPEGWETLE